jgi:hypothetical protein
MHLYNKAFIIIEEEAISSIKQMSDELKAGYRAIYSTDNEKRVAHS